MWRMHGPTCVPSVLLLRRFRCARLLASDEANADRSYKQKSLECHRRSTVRTELFDRGWERASHRAVRNEVARVGGGRCPWVGQKRAAR